MNLHLDSEANSTSDDNIAEDARNELCDTEVSF